MRTPQKVATAVLLALGPVALGACRAETQNQFRRQVLDVANQRWYITLYSLDGQEVFRGEVDGKVTRAESDSAGTGGEYVYWFDPRGRYFQTSLPYLATTDPQRTGQLTTPGSAPAGPAAR